MKRLNGIITILTLAIAAAIGYNSNLTTTAIAETQIKVIEIPRLQENPGFNLNIDLNSNEVVANASNDIKVNINKKDSIITRWKTRIIYEPKIEYRRVIQLPPITQDKTVVSHLARTSVSSNTQKNI